MNRKQPLIALLVAALLGAGGYALYGAGRQHGMDLASSETVPGKAVAAADPSN